MMKQMKIALMMVLLSLAVSLTVFAHGGKTDSKGGHRDRNDESGLGGYHFHCDGFPAHLHPNGVCPYTSQEPTAPTQTPAPTIAPQNDREQQYKERIKSNLYALAVLIPLAAFAGILAYREQKKEEKQ